MKPTFTSICKVMTAMLLVLTINTSAALRGSDFADIYKNVGETIVLSPGSVPDTNTVITWKHEKDTVLDWYGDKLKIYQEFKGRCTLNIITGELTISGLTLKDSGSYTAEVNNKVLDTTKIQVISAVPTPTVSKSCDAENTHCVFICECTTTDAEPVTYTWWSGEEMKSKTKELNITTEEKEPSFVCKVENPVSSESSKPVDNPFITSSSNTQNLYWLFILVVLIPVVVGVVFYLRKIGKGNKDMNPDIKNGVLLT